MRCWRGYEERSTQSCRSVGEPVEGPDCTTDNGEPITEPVCSIVVDLEA